MGRMRITREQALNIILRDSGETFKAFVHILFWRSSRQVSRKLAPSTIDGIAFSFKNWLRGKDS